MTLLSIGKPRAVDKIASILWVRHFKSSVCLCWAVIGNDAAENIFNVTIYKTLKWTESITVKFPPSTETLVWLNIIGWVGGSLLRCSYYHEYLTCGEEDFSERYILAEGDRELLSGEDLIILLNLLSYSLTVHMENSINK